MKKTFISKLVKEVMQKTPATKSTNVLPQSSEKVPRITEVREFSQSGSFRGFKRYKLTTYQQYGVDKGIEHFRSNDGLTVTQGTPIKLVLKEGDGFKVIEVYSDGYKVGVIYDTRDDYSEILSKPFDKVHIRMDSPETIINKDGAEQRPIVYLFVHYSE